MPGNTWQENLTVRVKTTCKNEFCTNVVETIPGVVAAQGKYCDECRPEAIRVSRQNYEDRNSVHRRARKR